MKNIKSIVFERQKPLLDLYKVRPEEAMITDVAWVKGQDLEDPFHTDVILSEEIRHKIPVGLHRAVGGLHDMGNPGDLLCAALAACMESTIRMVANRMGLQLAETFIRATAHVDVRGTLMVDTSVPVAFQKINLEIGVRLKEDENQSMLKVLIKTAKHCCVVYQTLQAALPIEVTYA